MNATTTSRQPLIGVMCCNRVVDGRSSQIVANRFISPLMKISGVSAVIVPAMPGALDPQLAGAVFDGLLLTGSCSNISPRRYGSDAEEIHPDHDRDETVARIAGAMIEKGKPVFGICRGMQELNILFGGTLDPHVNVDMSHHAPEAPESHIELLFEHAHEITLTERGALSGLFKSVKSVVNSVHHQGVDRLGPGLTIEARAPDGLIEAFHARPLGADILGVQWHPEYDAHINPQSRAFFQAMGKVFHGAPLAL